MRRTAVAGLSVVGVVIWIKIASMLTLNLLATSAWSSGDFGAGEGFARALSLANVVEPHTAPFNQGTLLAAEGKLGEARARLEEALALAPPADECVVRLNLTLVVEALALEARTAQGEATDASDDRLADARAITAAATPSCRDGLLAGVAARLATAPSSQAESTPDPPAAQPTPGPFDQVARRLAEGAQAEADRESDRVPVTTAPVARPW